MPTGVIYSFNADKGEGYVQPDGQDEQFPFEIDQAPTDEPFRKGDHVRFEIEGGMAGLWAKNVRRIAPENTP